MNGVKFDIWGKDPPEEWVRDFAWRWAEIIKRGAFIYFAIFNASPLPRTETETLFLLLIEDGEKSEPAILASRQHISRQSMTGVLDKLEARGYVVREAHPTDRRRTSVALTEKGRSLACEITGRVLRRDAGLIADFDRTEAGRALDFMESLASRVEKWNQEHPL